ncbi:MAG: hypothetical protein ACXVHC_08405, partial [Frankiaceae bacterium]
MAGPVEDFQPGARQGLAGVHTVGDRDQAVARPPHDHDGNASPRLHPFQAADGLTTRVDDGSDR